MKLNRCVLVKLTHSLKKITFLLTLCECQSAEGRRREYILLVTVCNKK